MARSDKILQRGSRPQAAGGAPIHKKSREYRQMAHDLNERVKELTLLHRATRLLQETCVDPHKVLAELVRLLPPAWQYQVICEARVIHGDMEARTAGWEDTPWKLSSPFVTSDGRSGAVEVSYVKPPPEGVEDFFLPEERVLLESVTQLVAAWLERCIAETRAARPAGKG